MRKNKHFFQLVLATQLIFCGFQEVFSIEILRAGAEVGKYTMDLEAALNLAQKNRLAVFLDLTGSDWCGWCIYMKKNVFKTDEWVSFASSNLTLATIDFPQNPNIVPEKYKQRNLELQQKFSIAGFPTFIILDPGGSKILGRMGASAQTSAKSFINEVRAVLRQSGSLDTTMIKDLSDEVAEEYKLLVEKLNQKKSDLEAWLQSKPEENDENFQAFADFNRDITLLMNGIDKIEAEQYAKKLSSDKAGKYMKIVSELNTVRIELDEWLQSRPPNSNENRMKHASLEKKIKDLTDKKSQF